MQFAVAPGSVFHLNHGAYSAFAIEHMCMWDFIRNMPKSSLNQEVPNWIQAKRKSKFVILAFKMAME